MLQPETQILCNVLRGKRKVIGKLLFVFRRQVLVNSINTYSPCRRNNSICESWSIVRSPSRSSKPVQAPPEKMLPTWRIREIQLFCFVHLAVRRRWVWREWANYYTQHELGVKRSYEWKCFSALCRDTTTSCVSVFERWAYFSHKSRRFEEITN